MLGASSIFILLSIFYYEYIPEDAFQRDELEDAQNAVENDAFDNIEENEKETEKESENETQTENSEL